MTRIHSRPTSRPAFTLIELLVVIAIIAVLVSLTAAAVMRTLGMIPEIQTRTEESMLESSLQSFMNDYQLSDPPPSLLILDETMAYNGSISPSIEAQSKAFLIRTFGKTLTAPIDWNGDGNAGNGKWVLEGEQCLVFYTGGIPVGGIPSGFSTNATNPAAFSGTTKPRGPYMNFNTARLVPGSAVGANLNTFPVYLDPWQVKPAINGKGPRPYAYFSSYGINNRYNPFPNPIAPSGTAGDCANVLAGAYNNGAQFTNPNKYQIISAGQDGVFGPGTWNPSSGATGAGRDDQANFSAKILGAGQQ